MALGSRRDARVQIDIHLDPSTGPLYPGDALSADITLQCRKETGVREARAGLVLWEKYHYTTTDSEGDTTRQSATDERFVFKQVLLPEGTIPAGFHQTYRLEWQIPPDVPPPYAGKITTNRWLVKVTIDRKLRKDINEEVELPIVVPPPGRWTEPGEFGDASHPGRVDMSLWLPRLEWVEGQTVEGRLLVCPSEDVTVREVRAELTRREYVPRDRGNTNQVTEEAIKLAGKTGFRAGEGIEFPFALAIPTQGRPTRETPNSRVTWEIRGVLGRRLRKDISVAAEIFVYNGAPRA